MRRADELLPEAPKPKRGRPPKAKAQALANYDAGDVERPAGERWVTMSNALTRAGHGLTLECAALWPVSTASPPVATAMAMSSYKVTYSTRRRTPCRPGAAGAAAGEETDRVTGAFTVMAALYVRIADI